MHGRRILKNAGFSICSKMIVLLLNFITRKIFLVHLGNELLGLNSVYANVLELLNMSELGISGAIQFRMFKPLAEKNYKEINNILFYSGRIFYAIGVFILACGVIFSFFIELIVGDTDYELSKVRVSFIIGVLNIAISYFFTHHRLFLQTNEELYIVNTGDTSMNVVFSVLRIISMVYAESFLLYLLLGTIQALCSNLMIVALCRRKHPEISGKGYDKSAMQGILKDLKYVMPQKVSWYIYRSTDSLVITKILGLMSVALYANYMMVVSNLLLLYAQVINIVGSSFGILKNELNDKLLFRRKLRQIEFINFAAGLFLAVELYCLLDCFILLWIGREYVLGNSIVMLLAVDVFFFVSYQPLSLVFNITGKFKEDYKITLFIALANLSISVLLAYFIGMPGVIIGTLFCDVSSLLLRGKRIIFEYFNEEKRQYLLFWGRNLLTAILAGLICILLSKVILSTPTWHSLIISGFANFVIVGSVVALMNKKMDYCIECGKWAKHYMLQCWHN